VNSHRLPRTVVPSRYDIRLEPDLESATYAGEEIVQVEVRDETDDVQLNAVELTITSVVAEGEEGTRLEGTASLDPATEDRVHLRFPRALRPGEWSLRITFQGILNDQLHGFYRSTFKGADGQTHVMAGHAVRGRRRAPRVPVLGRARPEGRVRRDAGGARRLHRDLEHRARPRRTRSATAGAR
jgi:hypothetical protein